MKDIFGAFHNVMAQKKKLVVSLALVASVGGALVLCSTRPATVEPAMEKSGVGAGFSFSKDGTGFARPANNLSTKELFFKTMVLVLLVAVLGAAAIYVSKKFLPKVANLSGKKIRIIETVHLGPRKAVHLLKIGNQRLLVGSTNESITMLAEVTDALSEADVSAEEGGVGIGFGGAAGWDSHRIGGADR